MQQIFAVSVVSQLTVAERHKQVSYSRSKVMSLLYIFFVSLSACGKQRRTVCWMQVQRGG